MGFYKLISKEDKISLLKLTSESENLKKEYGGLAKEIKAYFELKKKISEKAKKGEKVHFTVKLKRRALYDKLNNDYNLINQKIEDWNIRLLEIAEKYQYLKLGDFLAAQNYLEG